MRLAALLLIGETLKEASGADLLRAVDDAEGTVRREAFRALGELPRTDAAVAALKKGLHDDDRYARASAAHGLRAWKAGLNADEKARAVAAAAPSEEFDSLSAEHASYLVDELFAEAHERQKAALERLTRLLTAHGARVPREALIAIDKLPREVGGSVLGTVYNGPCDETGHLGSIPMKLELFPLRQLALQELQKRKRARKDAEDR
jgi:hypothetical protein